MNIKYPKWLHPHRESIKKFFLRCRARCTLAKTRRKLLKSVNVIVIMLLLMMMMSSTYTQGGNPQNDLGAHPSHLSSLCVDPRVAASIRPIGRMLDAHFNTWNMWSVRQSFCWVRQKTHESHVMEENKFSSAQPKATMAIWARVESVLSASN